MLPGAWRDYLALETAASEIEAYEAQRVPGLLQTAAYARAPANQVEASGFGLHDLLAPAR